jgi:hypothetical protein
VHNPFDQLAKKVGKEALATSGPTVVQYEISRDAQHADLRHDPAPALVRGGAGLTGSAVAAPSPPGYARSMSLTPEQIADAQKYNPKIDGQRWAHATLPDETLRSLAVDSAEFAERVAALQAEEGIYQDGKLGPRTLQALIEREIALEVKAEQSGPADLGWWKVGDPWPAAARIGDAPQALAGESLDKYLRRMGVRHWSSYELTRVPGWQRNIEPIREDWQRIVPTLRLAEILRHELGGYPLITASAYRPRRYNTEVGGAPNSQHLTFRAVLLALDTERAEREDQQRLLYEVAARLFSDYAADLKMGLGFYTPMRGVRISIDTGFALRTWQADHVRRVIADLNLPLPDGLPG